MNDNHEERLLRLVAEEDAPVEEERRRRIDARGMGLIGAAVAGIILGTALGATGDRPRPTPPPPPTPVAEVPAEDGAPAP